MSRTRGDKLRASLAFEAARILAERGDEDFEKARRKAAERLNCRDRKQLPDNSEIASALDDYLALYGGERRRRSLRQQRLAALGAMKALGKFNPRLVGPVADGTANDHSPIRLYLFADTPEQLSLELLEMGIPWDEEEHTLLFPNGSRRNHPALCFLAGEHAVELFCLPQAEAHCPPISPVNNRPERGLTRRQLEEMLDQPC